MLSKEVWIPREEDRWMENFSEDLRNTIMKKKHKAKLVPSKDLDVVIGERIKVENLSEPLKDLLGE